MCFPKPKDTRLSYKDAFDAVKVGGPRCYKVPSQISAKERQVEVISQEDGTSLVRWHYEDGAYSEEYTLRTNLDAGAVPKPDGTGVVVGGHPVTLEFYKRVSPARR